VQICPNCGRENAEDARFCSGCGTRLDDDALDRFPAADARWLAAETLAAVGRRGEAEAELEQALAFYRSVGATRYVREAERLLASVSEIPA
jgi:hypothetical protein